MHQKVKELSKRKKKRPTNSTNDKDGNKLTESRQTQSRWKEYIEKLYDKSSKPCSDEILHSLVFCCFQLVSDMHSHLLSCLHLDLSEIKSFNCPWSRLNLSTVHDLFLPSYHAITILFLQSVALLARLLFRGHNSKCIAVIWK